MTLKGRAEERPDIALSIERHCLTEKRNHSFKGRALQSFAKGMALSKLASAQKKVPALAMVPVTGLKYVFMEPWRPFQGHHWYQHD